MWLIKKASNGICFAFSMVAMVVRLLKRCHWCWFSFTSRLPLYYCVASPTVAAGTHRRHCQNSAPSAASYLPREKETVYETRNRTAKKQASAVQYLVVVSVSSFPSLLFICWWGAAVARNQRMSTVSF